MNISWKKIFLMTSGLYGWWKIENIYTCEYITNRYKSENKMREKTVLAFILIILVGCGHSEKQSGKIKITLYESYNLSEIYPSLVKTNLSIRQKQLDSISKTSSGISLLDKLNARVNTTDTIHQFTIDDYPLFQVLNPNIKFHDKTIDSSAIIGFASDTIKLLKYLDQTRSLFPNDLVWKIGGIRNEKSKVYCLHAFKNNAQKVELSVSDIDSILILRSDGIGLVGMAEEITNLKVMSTYWVKIKLKKELSNKLADKTYSLIINLDTRSFSGSVVNFVSNSTPVIVEGEMDSKDLMKLKTKFENKWKMY